MIDCDITEDGKFEAFSDKSIKITFPDRTVVRYNSDNSFCTILTNLGDHKKILLNDIENLGRNFYCYVKEMLKYANKAFLDEKDKAKQ